MEQKHNNEPQPIEPISAAIAANPLLPAVLRLTLKKKWYDMILSGEKKEEYREIKAYWISRFSAGNYNKWPIESARSFMYNSPMNNFDLVEFKNGYGKNAPTMVVEFKGIRIGEARPEWSDNWQGEVFAISLGAVLHSRYRTGLCAGWEIDFLPLGTAAN